MKFASLTGMVLASLIATCTADETVYDPVVGEVHPQIVLPRIDDRRPVKLTDYRGKKVLLIHFASW